MKTSMMKMSEMSAAKTSSVKRVTSRTRKLPSNMITSAVMIDSQMPIQTRNEMYSRPTESLSCVRVARVREI